MLFVLEVGEIVEEGDSKVVDALFVGDGARGEPFSVGPVPVASDGIVVNGELKGIVGAIKLEGGLLDGCFVHWHGYFDPGFIF